MVSVSKLINNGLILASQQVFSPVASPEQAAVEQYNILHFLGGAAPYIQHPGYGISTDIPSECTIEQVQLWSRHGERFPSTSSGKKYEALIKKLKTYNGTFTGDLAFLNDYSYFVEDTFWYEKETTPANSEGYFSGSSNAQRHGAAFRAKYNALFDGSKPLPVFSSNSRRCFQTSNYFARGFLGDNYTENAVDYVVISEAADQGTNSLTPRYACNAYDDEINEDLYSNYSTQYLEDAKKRFQKSNPGLNISADDVQTMFDYIPFEINVKGYSPFANIFTNEEFLHYSYYNDLDKYYSNGPGHNLTKVIGSTILNASLTLLQDTEADNKIWLSFSHDTDWEIVNAALGLMDPEHPLSPDAVPFPNPYVHSRLLPQGARFYTEKYSCGNDSYVRYILNDAVIPLKGCSGGPGFSCKMDDFEEYIANRLEGVNWVEQCEVYSNVSQSISFYWDYTTTKYNATLINK
ncbi:repressible acid phosphatase [[Candida] railenensis]|uniref:Repressible acid phosphatase n=1 Tax=[Candida] railenensis TaxID=45579 RepID=A0A9P0QL90_9ASCO|nr:repressible acid phosphatase [[Candida] railenensis]